MFGHNKEDNSPTEPVSETVQTSGDSRQKKGPTPSRKEAQSKRYRSLIAAERPNMTKEERKAYKQDQRKKRDEQLRLEQHAMDTGDQRHMPEIYKGTERRFARDYVDARFTISKFFLPLTVVMLVSLFLTNVIPQVILWLMLACYILIFLMMIDSFIAARNAFLLVQYKFGEDKVPNRLRRQMFERTLYPLRMRTPKPQVGHHEYPEGGTPEDLKKARAYHRDLKKTSKARG